MLRVLFKKLSQIVFQYVNKIKKDHYCVSFLKFYYVLFTKYKISEIIKEISNSIFWYRTILFQNLNGFEFKNAIMMNHTNKLREITFLSIEKVGLYASIVNI